MEIILGLISILISEAYARGGGGGSSSGGGGGGFGSSGSSSAGGSIFSLIFFVIVVVVFVYLAILAYKKRKKKIQETKEEIKEAALSDKSWDEGTLEARVSEVFYSFQRKWSESVVDGMKKDLTENYLKRIALELEVLNNEKRKNDVQTPSLKSITMLEAEDSPDDSKDTFTAEIKAVAHDILLDTETGKNLYVDNSSFTEYWTFIREGSTWKLDLIKQATESPSLEMPQIMDFSEQNGFFYDPDFGWLMMPNKGALFKKSNFKTSDINNHVIGLYRNKVVEFYTYIANTQNSGQNYIVAQAILPKSYHDILIKKRSFLSFKPWGLRSISLESPEFNKKFVLYADPRDQVNSLELLSPDFMEKVTDLGFDLNIEIVGNFLYFYVKESGMSQYMSYDQMLEIISWAFDEMKM